MAAEWLSVLSLNLLVLHVISSEQDLYKCRTVVVVMWNDGMVGLLEC